MDVEKLKKLAGSVRMGGKGTMRRYVHTVFPRLGHLEDSERDFLRATARVADARGRRSDGHTRPARRALDASRHV